MPSIYLKPGTSGKTNFHHAEHGTRPEMKPHEPDFAKLVNELTQRMMDEELFTFVLEPEVESANHLTERLQRAQRTSKSAAGPHRRNQSVRQAVASAAGRIAIHAPGYGIAARVRCRQCRWK
jgi:hypothetical protein